MRVNIPLQVAIVRALSFHAQSLIFLSDPWMFELKKLKVPELTRNAIHAHFLL